MTYSLDLVRTFEAVARSGSLLAASRNLGVSQPTVGRQIDQLEQALGLTLFVRSREGMLLTDAGADLVDASAEVTRAALDFDRRSSGLDQSVAGPVRISANDVFGVHVLPAILADFMQAQPDIDVELDINNRAANLLRRDADIALRMFRPVQNDLIARKICDVPLGFYAHRHYLERAGRPLIVPQLQQHRLIGFDREMSFIEGANAMGIALDQNSFGFRCDAIVAQIAAVQAGLGIGVLHQGMAAKFDGVERVMPQIDIPVLGLWLVCHGDVRTNRRIRLTYDYLAEKLRNPYAASPV